MDSKLFEEMGLTRGEAQVYLALLKIGSTKVGPLVAEARISSSKIYEILDKLENKGLAGHIFVGKIKHYSAMKPTRIIEYIEEQKEKLEGVRTLAEQVVPELEKKYAHGKKTEATLFEGFKAVTNAIKNRVDELEPGDSYSIIGANYGEEVALKMRRFFYKHNERRANKKIKLYMLANFSVRGTMEKTTFRRAEVRYLPQYLMTNMEIFVYKNKALVGLWAEDPIAILIENEELSKSFQAYFDVLWKIAKS